MLKRLGVTLEKLAAEKPVFLAFLVFLTATFIVIPISLPFYLADTIGFLENVLAEAHGTLFDLLIIGWFLLWLNRRAETRLNNNRYREEIEDYLGWKSQEATHRIAGNIRRLNRGGVRSGLRLTHAFLKGANLERAGLRNADLWGADLEGARLGGADLKGANMAGACLDGADLEHATLTRADLRGAVLEGADLERATLEEADLRGAIIRGADLQYAVLKRADLERADLAEANLREAVLEGAKLQRANLRGAGLTGAALEGTDLERADLRGAVLPEGEELPALFSGARSLFRARLDPEVEQELRSMHPQLFEWMKDSEIF